MAWSMLAIALSSCAAEGGSTRPRAASAVSPTASPSAPATMGPISSLAVDRPEASRSGPPPASSAAAPVAATPAAASMRSITGRELDELRPLLTDLVRNYVHESEPDASSEKLRFTTGAAREIVLDEARLVVVPLRVLGRCRLAVVHDGARGAEMVPLPMDADPVGCQRMDMVGEVDLNADGVPDFAFEVRVPSSRNGAIVSEGRVYLSRRGRQEYCYAPKLSVLAAGAPAAFRSGGRALRRLVDAEVNRIGASALDCWSEPAGH